MPSPEAKIILNPQEIQMIINTLCWAAGSVVAGLFLIRQLSQKDPSHIPYPPGQLNPLPTDPAPELDSPPPPDS